MTEQTEPKYQNLYAGAFCVFYGHDEETGQTLILITERGSNFIGRSEGHGTLGGFISLEEKEQPAEGAAREASEELPMPDGSPVLDEITADRLTFEAGGIDYKEKALASGLAGTAWFGHSCELTGAEIKKLKSYVHKIHTDPDFADAVRAASEQELGNAFLFTPEELLQKLQSGAISFAYKHEQKVVGKIADRLLKRDAILAHIPTL